MFRVTCLVFLLCWSITSCAPRPSVPMPKLFYAVNDKPSQQLIVLLRGIGGRIEYYEQNGWIMAMRKATQPLDMVAPDAHIGYYASRSIVPRLHEDIILPAQQQGYREIWLAGISLGGMGALLYSREYSERVQRIYLFAPYLGNVSVQDEIRIAGGLERWEMPAEKLNDHQYQVWQYLKQVVRDPRQRVKVYLAYGEGDHLPGHELLAASLPATQVIRIAGVHDDTTFLRLWQRTLQDGMLDPM